MKHRRQTQILVIALGVLLAAGAMSVTKFGARAAARTLAAKLKLPEVIPAALRERAGRLGAPQKNFGGMPTAPAVPVATITVTNGNDTGGGSLRNAISTAAANDTIVFSGVTTVTLTSGELAINKNLTIDGGSAGVTVTRSGSTQFRIFNITGGSTTVTLRALTITNGNHPSQAGGVQNSGVLTMENCTVTGNTSPQAGGVQNDKTATLTNCTISGNLAGGGIIEFGTTTSLTNCTITNNAGDGNNSGVGQFTGTVTLKNTIVLGNFDVSNSSLARDIRGTVSASSPFNLIGTGGDGGLVNNVNGNKVGVSVADALLAPLGSYGGPTKTHALLPGSVAINAGTNTGAPATDQRGIARPQLSTGDIGAFESQGFTLAASGGNNQNADVMAAFASPLAVTVTASGSEPVNGGRVTFTPPGSGPSCTIAGNPTAIAGGTASSGTVTANNTAGTYNVTASTAGATSSASFTLTNNFVVTPPTITPVNITRLQGDPASNSTIATVSDTSAGTLTVQATTVPAGISVSNIVNNGGTVTADVAASCAAARFANTVVLTVTNSSTGLSSTANLTVNVQPSPPSVSYGSINLVFGATTTVAPASATDNGSIVSYGIESISPPLYPAPTINSGTGAVTITDARPAGTHFIEVGVTDNCGTTNMTGFNATIACVSGNQVVTNLNDSGPGSLRDAIDGACGPVTITFAPGLTGTITLQSTLNLNKSLTIQGPGANVITVSGNDAVPVFIAGPYVSGATVTISGLTIAHSSGAGIRASGSDAPSVLNLNDSVVADNSSVGATACCGWSLNVSGSTFTRNRGGGIYASSNNNLAVTNSMIIGNSGGPGVSRNSGGTGTITGSTIANNTVTVPSGDSSRAIAGIEVCCGASLTITNSTIANNTATGSGSSTSQATGGIDVGGGASLTITNSTITGNQASNANIARGGLAASCGGQLTLIQNTIYGNAASGVDASSFVSGGVDTGSGLGAVVSILNNIIAGNTASNSAADVRGTLTSQGNNLIGDGTGGTGFIASDLVGTTASPINPLLAALSNYGGPTQTLALLPGSPAINAGNNTGAPATDQRGVPRPKQGAVDIGAYESQGFTLAVSGGNSQSAVVNTDFASPLSVTVTANGAGEPVNGGQITFTPPGSGASAMLAGSPATITAGVAATGTIRANHLVGGPYTVSANASGATAVGFSLTNLSCVAATLSPATLPNSTLGANYNQTITASPAGTYAFVVTSGALPPGLVLNSGTGSLTGSPTVLGTFNFTIAANGSGGCSGSQNYTVAINCASSLEPSALPNATAGVGFSQQLSVTPPGGYTYSLIQGNLPPGFSLNGATGLLSGIASVTGSYSFTIRAGSGSCNVTRQYTLTVNCPAVSLNPASLPDGVKGTAYSQVLSASPAGGNYTFAVTGGALPGGLSLNPSTGVLSGTPTTNGTFNFGITSTGFGACAGTRNYSITIGGGSCPTITLPALPDGSVGQMYSNAVAASPAGTYGYAMAAGSLPPGLSLFDGVGLIYGYPVASGNYTFTVKATDLNNCVGERAYTVAINSGVISNPNARPGDFNGDGKTDFALWRASQSQWLILDSGTDMLRRVTWAEGVAPHKDLIVPGDYDGDGKTDVAVFRAGAADGAHWLIKRSSDGQTIDKLWGLATDTPVPGDYDGDGKTDIAVWRGSESHWYIARSSDGQVQAVPWGTSNAPYRDIPVPADYDGDGKTDIAVFRQANGHWYIKLSSDGSVLDKAWGLGTDIPVAADYDGDGKADLAVWRGAETNWYILLSGRSSDGQTRTISWGTSSLGDVPAPGDYDGDGKVDVAVWREADGTWYVKCSRDDSVMVRAQGAQGDRPVNARKFD